MFDIITATIEQLKSQAVAWYESLWPNETPATPARPVVPTEKPTVVKSPVVPTQPPPAQRPVQTPVQKPTVPSRPRDPGTVQHKIPAAQPEKRPNLVQPPPTKRDIRRAPIIPPDVFSSRGRSLQHLVDGTRSDLRRQFFSKQIVGFTGRLPHDPSDIKTLIRQLGGIPGFDGLWQAQQLMIIGREGFDPMYLKHSVQVGMQQGFECHYISQEALTGLLQFGKLPGYYRGDSRISDHPGLRCIADFGFVWPTTAVGQAGDTDVEKDSEWRLQHELVSMYGYRVDARTGLTLAERQARLRQAVEGLGLRCVAEHIASNIQLAKNRRTTNMESAIDKWEDDLDWLYERFYANSIHSFIWPRVYRRRRKAS